MTTSGARRLLSALAAITVAVFVSAFAFTHPPRSADPIKVGFSVSLTGAVAPNGKQIHRGGKFDNGEDIWKRSG